MPNRPFIDVYIYEKNFPFLERPIIEWRQKEIDKDKTEDKLWTWRLLEKACKRSLRKELNDLNPRKLETERIVIDGYYISMSNSGDYFMVAISSDPVGVDIQKVIERADKHFCSEADTWAEGERVFLSKDDHIHNFMYWVRKEALYKLDNRGIPYNTSTHKLFDTSEYNDYFIDGNLNRRDAFWSVASPLIAQGIEPRFFFWPRANEDYL